MPGQWSKNYIDRLKGLADVPIHLPLLKTYARCFLFVDDIKEGQPTEGELEDLSRKLEEWKPLGRQLGFEGGDLKAVDKDNEEWSEKKFEMLKKWRQWKAKDATYRVLYHALCHVRRTDLAQAYCCHWLGVKDVRRGQKRELLKNGKAKMQLTEFYMRCALPYNRAPDGFSADVLLPVIGERNVNV